MIPPHIPVTPEEDEAWEFWERVRNIAQLLDVSLLRPHLAEERDVRQVRTKLAD